MAERTASEVMSLYVIGACRSGRKRKPSVSGNEVEMAMKSVIGYSFE